MPDVTEQLTAYFDATVERVTAEDVLAGAEVGSQNGRLAPTRVPRLRPAWVVAAGFAATIVVVGSAVGVVHFMESDSADVGTVPPPIAEGGDGLSAPWVILIAAGVILVLAAAGLVWRSRREIVKEKAMQTLEKPEVEVSPRPRSPAILILLAALLVLAAGAVGWWIGSSGDSAAPEVPEIVELVNQAWVDGDADALEALYAEDGVFTDVEIDESLTQNVRSSATGPGISSLVGLSMELADLESLSVDEIAVLDNVIAYQWTASGMSGSRNPSERVPFETTGLMVLEMENGLIVSSTSYYDGSELYNTDLP